MITSTTEYYLCIDRDNDDIEAIVDEDELVHRHIKKFQVRIFCQTRSLIASEDRFH